MDETTLSGVQHPSQGIVPDRHVQRAQGMVRRRRRPDRSDVRTCLLGTVCNDAELQPHLPQVVLPAYSKHVRPPVNVLNAYQRTRAPLEYWHGTNGWCSTTIIIRWLTRLRAVISSAKPGAWIVLIWDCASVHLNAAVLGHMRRLQLLVLFIPAGMTHLFQVLDVFIYADLKRRMRQHHLRRSCAAADGNLDRDHRIDGVGRAIHSALVQVDCRGFFHRVGLAADWGGVTGDIFDLIGGDPIAPALPSREEFATLTGSTLHTPRTASLHTLAMSGWLQLRRQPMTASPRPAAHVALPKRAAARPRDNGFPRDTDPGMADVRMHVLRRRHADSVADGPVDDPAVNVFMAPAAGDA